MPVLLGSSGMLIAGGFFQAFSPSLFLSVFGMIGTQFVNMIAPSVTQDLIQVSELITGKDAVLATRDTIAILVGFSFTFSAMIGGGVLGFIVDYVSFQVIISTFAVAIFILGANYIFASQLPSSRIFKFSRSKGTKNLSKTVVSATPI
jgi:hypothetical protein